MAGTLDPARARNLMMPGSGNATNLMPGFDNATNLAMPNSTLPIPDRAGNLADLFKWQLVYSPNTSPAARRMARNITAMLDMTPIGISS